MSNATPIWMDVVTLAHNLCISTRTVDHWVGKQIIPPPVKRGNKMLWKWKEVDAWITNGKPEPETQAERIRNGTREESHSRY